MNNAEGGGIFLEHITWLEAEQWLSPDRVVVIPLGAAAKEHGPHLPLSNDAITANWLAREVCARLPVVIAPLLNLHYYPAFVEYPGSISLSDDTARDVLIDVCRSLTRFGPTVFFVINTGVSTEGPLTQSARELEREGIELHFSRLESIYATLPDDLFQQTHGTHADERETSLMLHIAPDVVDMDKAVADGSAGKGRLSRLRGQGVYSPSGVYGDATLANERKGEQLADAMVTALCAEISGLIRREKGDE
ncbi:MAG: creatininase family protein [Pseudomonadota bacterium]